jgi:hypothetical protein
MFMHAEIQLEIARQRHQDRLAEAERRRLALTLRQPRRRSGGIEPPIERLALGAGMRGEASAGCG